MSTLPLLYTPGIILHRLINAFKMFLQSIQITFIYLISSVPAQGLFYIVPNRIFFETVRYCMKIDLRCMPGISVIEALIRDRVIFK
jgi:hypothetical protein